MPRHSIASLKTFSSRFIATCLLTSACAHVSAQQASFVAVTDDGTNAAYSFDGINWFASPGGMAVSGQWQSVAFGGGNFVAISTDGNTNAAYSTNGIDWSLSPTGLPQTQGNWQQVICSDGFFYTNGTFIAISYLDGLLAYSADGANWTNLLGIMTDPTYLMGDCWSIACANSPGSTEVVVASLADEASAWNYNGPVGAWVITNSLPSLGAWVIGYGGGEFVAISVLNKAVYGTDGEHWTSSSLPVSGSWDSVAYGNGAFVGVAGDSTNAVTAPTSGSVGRHRPCRPASTVGGV